MYAIRSYYELLDFLILHPEYYHELHAAGMGEVVTHPLAQEIFAHIGRRAQGETCQPEDLLGGIEDLDVHAYIVELLTALPPPAEEDAPEPRITSYNVCYTKLLRVH